MQRVGRISLGNIVISDYAPSRLRLLGWGHCRLTQHNPSNYLCSAVMIAVAAEAVADTAAAITDQSIYFAFSCVADAESTAASAALVAAFAALTSASAAEICAVDAL